MASQHCNNNNHQPAVGLTITELQAQLLGPARRNAVLPSQAVLDAMERQEQQRQQERRERRRRREFAERRRARLFETEEQRREVEEDEEDYERIAGWEGWVKVELTEEGLRLLWEEVGMVSDEGDVVWVRRESEVRRR